MNSHAQLEGEVRFTAVVVTWNSADEVCGLIESVEHHLGRQCRLLFVDNASTDDTVSTIWRLAPRTPVIRLDRNVGFGAASNIGVEAAETHVVALVNPDIMLIDSSLRDLVSLASHERALFAPRLLNPDGTVQISARPALGSWESALISIWPGALMPPRLRMRCEPWRYDLRLPAGWLSGACLVATRALLREFGPFDDRLVLYGEDADLALRAWLAGVPSVSAPDVARVVHLGNRSASQAFDDSGAQRKIEARWWVVHERLGAVAGVVDLGAECSLYATRYVVKRLLQREFSNEERWIRGAVRVIQSGRPRLRPLPNQMLDKSRADTSAGVCAGSSDPGDSPQLKAVVSGSWSRRLAQLDRPRAVSNSWFAVRYLLGSHRRTFPLLRMAPAPYSRVMTAADTDACIDGLPKSASTLAGWVFMNQNPGVRVAHHMHVPMQIERAVRLGIPTAVLIRPPLQNLTAIVTSPARGLSLSLALRVYIHYFRRLQTLGDKIVLCTFDQIVDDPSLVAWTLNRRFDASFNANRVSDRYRLLLESKITRHERVLGARPPTATDPAELQMGTRRVGATQQVSNHPLYATAEALYAELASFSMERIQ